VYRLATGLSIRDFEFGDLFADLSLRLHSRNPALAVAKCERAAKITLAAHYSPLKRHFHKSKNDRGSPFGERPMLPEPYQLSPWRFD
jgi:hypothetical protein